MVGGVAGSLALTCEDGVVLCREIDWATYITAKNNAYIHKSLQTPSIHSDCAPPPPPPHGEKLKDRLRLVCLLASLWRRWRRDAVISTMKKQHQSQKKKKIIERAAMMNHFIIHGDSTNYLPLELSVGTYLHVEYSKKAFYKLSSLLSLP